VKPYLILFFTGAVAGTFLDFLQTNAGHAYYTDPFLFQTAWWVPFLFGGATVGIGLTHCKLDYGRGRFFGSLVFLILACLVTAFLKTENFQKAGLLFILYAVSWWFFSRTGWSLLLAVGTAFIGSAFESFLGYLGLYHYTHPDFFGIPLWLPFLYLHVSQAGGYLGRILLKRLFA